MRSEAVRQSLIESTGIDFAAYRHDDLVEALDVTSALFKSIQRAVMVGLALTAAAGLGIWMTSNGSVAAALALAVVGLAAAATGAIAAWIGSLGDSLGTQVGSVLDIAAYSAARFREDLTSTDRTPGDRELADGILQVALIPALGSAVRRRVWVVGRPLALLTERVMGAVLGRATAGLGGSQATSAADGIAERLETIVGLLREAVDPVVDRFQRWLIRPLKLVLTTTALLLAAVFVMLAVALGN